MAETTATNSGSGKGMAFAVESRRVARRAKAAGCNVLASREWTAEMLASRANQGEEYYTITFPTDWSHKKIARWLSKSA
jgi:phage terminase large subunit-like protein